VPGVRLREEQSVDVVPAGQVTWSCFWGGQMELIADIEAGVGRCRKNSGPTMVPVMRELSATRVPVMYW